MNSTSKKEVGLLPRPFRNYLKIMTIFIAKPIYNDADDKDC